jgi:uncharacterized DUF497 family protein
MRVTWDQAKADINLTHHRVSFTDAAGVFALPEHFRYTLFDAGHNEDEDRWITVGLVSRGLLLVVYTIRGPHDDEYRMISARVADADERRAYADHLAGE